MADNSAKLIMATLLLFFMMSYSILPCDAAREDPPHRIKDPGGVGSRTICPACVCCGPPPRPGSCCKCSCSIPTPMAAQSNNNSDSP
ncbi:hypothetical protein JCGZ_24828 [Jatropha curcas]|uniref:Uncharacterized protein n=1 Tax=Jatropha curcas TaxID=180498 RepID=A0A067L9Q4_JATCU|nr:hypothetical protein JCGZ_24828 [Jatropha curcas]